MTLSRRTQAQLVEQNMGNITEMKVVQKQYSELMIALIAKPKDTGMIKTLQLDVQQRVDGLWIKAERTNNDMIRMFSQLLK